MQGVILQFVFGIAARAISVRRREVVGRYDGMRVVYFLYIKLNHVYLPICGNSISGSYKCVLLIKLTKPK